MSAPVQVQASFFSAILGGEAHAETEVVDPTQLNQNIQKNSQTMGLLQANVSPSSVIQEKQEKKGKKSSEIGGTIGGDVDMNIVSDNALLPATGPMGVSDGKDGIDALKETSVYVVRKGDSISGIAEMFGVSINTILLANDIKRGDKLSEGDVLFIFPFSSKEHTISKGQTLKSIAKLYKVDIIDITLYNDIAQDSDLKIGDKILIPGADSMDNEGGDKPASNLGSALARDKNYYATHPIQNLVGYFINPVPTGHKTQGLHGPGHRGIDIGDKTGANIYASAPGVVSIVKTGCKLGQTRCAGGYGNMVVIAHPNGTKTLYAHQSKVLTHTGAKVERGEVIGYVGSTGRSTGPHIHFEVLGAKNPGSDWSWSN